MYNVNKYIQCVCDYVCMYVCSSVGAMNIKFDVGTTRTIFNNYSSPFTISLQYHPLLQGRSHGKNWSLHETFLVSLFDCCIKENICRLQYNTA